MFCLNLKSPHFNQFQFTYVVLEFRSLFKYNLSQIVDNFPPFVRIFLWSFQKLNENQSLFAGWYIWRLQASPYDHCRRILILIIIFFVAFFVNCNNILLFYTTHVLHKNKRTHIYIHIYITDKNIFIYFKTYVSLEIRTE